MDSKKQIAGHVLASVTSLIWGMTFISTKILLQDFSPIEILFIRFALGFIALFLIHPHLLSFKSWKEELYFAVAGLSGVTLYFLFENIALTLTFASNVGVIVAVAPFFTALCAYLVGSGEKPAVQFFLGFIAALAGIFLISFNGSMNFRLNPGGDVLALLAAVMWAIYSVVTKKISDFGYNTIQATRRIFLYGVVFMIPALFLLDFKPDLQALTKPANLFNILFLGLGASALCFVTWNSALRILGVVKTSVYIYLVPVITVVTSALVLGEPITGTAILGTVLTLAGLLISGGRRSSREKDVKHG